MLKILVRKICLTMSIYELPVIYLCLDIKSWNKLYDRICMETATLINIVHARDVFMTTSFIHNMLCLFIICDSLGNGSYQY